MARNVVIGVLLFFIIQSSVWADALIVPGTRLSSAFMNQPMDLVLRSWGEPDEKEGRGEKMTVMRNKRYLTVFYEKEGVLGGIETFSSRFNTSSGIKVGSFRQDVVNAFGNPVDQENYSFFCFDGVTRDFYSFVYKSEGIGFSFNPETHRVTSIFVFPLGGYLNVSHQ
jgi:hypothetical protein